MGSGPKTRDAINRLIEAGAAMQHALESARHALNLQDQELLELRRECAVKQAEFFTEAQFAEKLKISARTLARMRKRGEVKFTMVSGEYRYTSLQLEELAQTAAAMVLPLRDRVVPLQRRRRAG